MHSLCLVVGEPVEKLLEPFAEYNELPPYKEYLDADAITSMSAHYGIPATDFASLATKVRDYTGTDGGLEDGRLFFWSTTNPNSKFDWYEVGGRFDGCLQLLKPVSPGAWQKMLGKQPSDRTNRAQKSELKQDALLADPPAVLLLNGDWHECPLTTDEAELAKWKEEFARIFKMVPDDAILTAVDIHS